MKLNNKVKIFIIAMLVALVTIAGLAFAHNLEERKSEDVVTREYSSVYFEPISGDPTKVDVYLGMHDTASIASFQIGLEIDMADCYDSTFDWTTGELNNLDTTKFKEFRSSEQRRDEVTGNLVENLNLYYVGTGELNELTSTKDVDHIKLGTISIVPDKDAQNEDVPVRSSFVAIKPREDFSKTISLSHEPEIIKTNQNSSYSTKITIKEAPMIDNLTASVEAIIEGDVANGQSTDGSKVVVNFEVTDSTNSLTALEVRLVDEKGNVKTKTIDLQNLNNEIPVSFVKIEEGTYKVQVVGSYTLDGGVSVSNEVLKTSSGADAELSDIKVIHTEETNSGGSSSSGESSGSGGSSSSEESSGSGESSNSGSSSNSEASSKPDNKGKGDSVGSKIIQAIKTGANLSVTWVIVALIVLIIIAVAIVRMKNKAKGKSKH